MLEMFKKILVAFDGSESSKLALDQAVQLTSKLKADLVILSVVPNVLMPVFPDEGFAAAPVTAAQDMSDYQDKMKEVFKASLIEVEKDIQEAYPDIKVTAVLKEGRPSATIVEAGDEYEVDLIVIGSRGLGGITGWILGSTSRRVVESCTKPILIIKIPD
jgi:nucleotide-binding universal stress UspA family protein